MTGNLYIVATPIGNLEDVTLRAIKILSEVDIILAEDTRVTKKLIDFILSLNSLPTTHHQQLTSYHQHSPGSKKLEILSYLLQGKNIALVTDAGTPGLSDPGNELIDFILEQNDNIPIIPIPGASAITSALSVSGFNINKFMFLGFWPKKKVNKFIRLIEFTKLPVVFYESPHRISKTLNLIKESFGEETRVCVTRELTKMHETIYRGKVREVIEQLGKQEIRGEITVIVDLQKKSAY